MRRGIIALLFISLFFMAGCSFICDNIGDSDHCYKFFAERKGDAKGCENIEKVGPKSKCLMMIAANTNNVKLCEDLPIGFGAYSKFECYQTVAIKTGDPGMCARIGEYTGSSTDVSPSGVSKKTCIEKANKDPGKSSCGWNGQACCEGGVCKEEFKCTMYGVCETSCGERGENCCMLGSKCSGSLQCTSDYQCVESCGGKFEKCCLGRHCGPGLECLEGGHMCNFICGELDTQCCADSQANLYCNENLKCVDKMCVTES